MNTLFPPAQTETLVCQICGHTWTSPDKATIVKAWNSHPETDGQRGPICDLCWTIWSAKRQAAARGMSLKDAVGEFLSGRSKRTRKPAREIWSEVRK